MYEKKKHNMICYKLSVRRLFVCFILLSMLVYLHYVVISPSNKNRVEFAALDQSETTTTTTTTAATTTTIDNTLTAKQVRSNVTVTNNTRSFLINRSNRSAFWFFRNGTIKPMPIKINGQNESKMLKLWPEEADPNEDRILNQLMYVPENYREDSPIKSIIIYPNLNDWAEPGQKSFLKNNCPVNRCNVTDNMNVALTADAIVFRSSLPYAQYERPSNQVWIMHTLESPYHTSSFRNNDAINWTATYRRNSDIVTPYARWVYYDDNFKQQSKPLKNYALNKTKKVAWFVSNCGAKNNRLKYAKLLQEYIDVDIYGQCGNLRCPRVERCFKLLKKEYKFYLAFENSNCFDYITEKFFYNGLEHDILPIVMGARPKDYELAAPKGSYIHVDDFESPQMLAEYLHILDTDDDLYNSYFLWKGTGEFVDTHSLCRICAMLHGNHPSKWYRNINRWWNVQDQCTYENWNQSESW